MKRFVTFLIVVALSGVGMDVFSQTSLTATEGTPTLDGVESPGEWTSGMITTAKGLTIKSMIDDQYLYVLATWMDATSTENVAKNQWSFDGASWSQSGDEDRVGIIWDMGQNGAEGANCASMCHFPIMNTATGKVDVWHWKAARTNPLGFADDKHWLTDGRHGDAGSGIDSKNSPMGSGFPSFMGAQDPGANLDFLLGDLDALNGFDPFGVIAGTADTTVAFDSTAVFATGAVIPGRILSMPTGNRASVQAAGKYDNGKWTVEFRRLVESDADDFQVVRGGSVQFTTEIFDNEGSTHLNDGFDTTVFTLNFPAAPGAGTSLTATIGTPTLDGVASPGEWTSDMITTSKGLTIKSMIDENNLYVLATWMDATSTENVAKNQWSFDGASWSQSGDEDRVGIIWDMGQNGAEGANCASMCHFPIMNTATGKVDVWHWKAARTNPLGFADDKHWLTDGRHGDAGSGIDSKNSPMGSGFPSFMGAQDPGANLDFLLGDLDALNGFDPFGVIAGTADTTVAFDSTAVFATGAVIPGRILSLPTGNRASVRSAGKYDNGMWTVEFSRPLVSDADDFEVVPGGSVEFTTEIFNNEGATHLNDGFDTTVFTMNFPTLPT
ncbi:MAG: ethylbenzene dehydrogenase-related protein, partial [bacterium]